MKSLRETLQFVLNDYLAVKSDPKGFSSLSPIYRTLDTVLPFLFKEAGQFSSDFLVKGSMGKGNFAAIPWICFFHKDVTTSAQTGFYVCILFREDMKGFYISLNQGWTQYLQKFGPKIGRIEIRSNAQKARSILRTTRDFQADSIDLNASTSLGKGYEVGNIFSKYFASNALPSDQDLLNTLQQLMGAYKELIGIVGSDILNIRTLSSEEDYQLEVQNTEAVDLQPGPIGRKDRKGLPKLRLLWPRNPGIARSALEAANYQCEVDRGHITFTSQATQNPFVEAHHLVPMEKQGEFIVSLDVPENIVALCPTCHRKIHLASQGERNELIDMLFTKRSLALQQRGINVQNNDLKMVYTKLAIEE